MSQAVFRDAIKENFALGPFSVDEEKQFWGECLNIIGKDSLNDLRMILHSPKPSLLLHKFGRSELIPDENWIDRLVEKICRGKPFGYRELHVGGKPFSCYTQDGEKLRAIALDEKREFRESMREYKTHVIFLRKP